MEPLGPWVDWLLRFGWLVVGYGAAVTAWLTWDLLTGPTRVAGPKRNRERCDASHPARRASDRRA